MKAKEACGHRKERNCAGHPNCILRGLNRKIYSLNWNVYYACVYFTDIYTHIYINIGHVHGHTNIHNRNE